MAQQFQTLSDYLIQKGEEQGEARGRAQGEILGTIRTCREYEISEDKIFNKLISTFKLQESEARQFMEDARMPFHAVSL